MLEATRSATMIPMPTSPIASDSGVLAGSDAADVAMVAEVERKLGTFMEIGSTGLKRASGYLDEEFLPQLRGRKAVGIYREMGDNDPIVGALLFAIRMLLRNLEWRVEPAGKSKDHANAAKLIETAMEDMSHSWDELISEALSSVQYGWAWHEVVYKRRTGPWQRDGKQRSKYTDDLIGWRKIPIRSQETLLRWVFDEGGGVRAMVQLAPPTYKTAVLPIERSALFRFGQVKNSPEGRSALRNAYRPWFYKKRIEEIEAIGIERDLAGLPMVSVPASFLKALPGTPQYKQVQAFQKMVRSIRRDEQEGLVFPMEYDQDTKQPLYKFELLNSGGARSFDTGKIIELYEQRILMTVLADFILVGHENTGTYNMHLDKTGMFRNALNATTATIADIFNRHVIPRLFAINGWKPSELPKLVPSDVDAPNLTELVAFLTGTAQLGFNWGPDADLEKFLRSTAGLPDIGEGDEGKHRTMARREEAARLAESQIRLLETRTMLAQAEMAAQQAEMGEPPLDPETEGMAAENAQNAEMHEMDAAGKEQEQALAGAQGEQQLAQADDTHQMDMASRKQEMTFAQRRMAIEERKAKLAEMQAKAQARQSGPSGNKKPSGNTKGTSAKKKAR